MISRAKQLPTEAEGVMMMGYSLSGAKIPDLFLFA
jgi:hypothetical protein